MKATILFLAAAISLSSCSKMADAILDKTVPGTTSNQFVQYTIASGQQYCDRSGYQSVDAQEMKFSVRFDSSAIYQTRLLENQYDINKLFGFSDNNSDHHQYSARIGWRWSDNALRLFAYVYNKGAVQSQELAAVAIGAEINCSIKIAGSRYIFSVNGVETEMPRMSTTATGQGYQLYPYFGGDETAPHEIRIWIKNL